ncbi:WD40 repeat domain-containing protein [Nostoc sp.]|uniref:WD40 repeat domain-containing protein n=1 Tax=Nostoc sp. TaxID=1180 RepID=UPI002FFC24D0
MAISNNDKKEKITLSDNSKLIKYSSSVIRRGLELANSITQNEIKESVNQTPQLTTQENIQLQRKSWKCIHTLIGHSKEIIYEEKTYTIWGDNNSISISDDCQLLATINQWGKAEIWNISKRQLIYPLDCSYDFDQYNNRSHWLSKLALYSYTLGQNYHISILSDNQSFVSINSEEIKTWNIINRQLKYIIPGSTCFDVNQEKQIVVIYNNDSIEVINLSNGHVLHKLPLEDFYTLENIIISRNGIFIAASGSKFLNCHHDENGEEYYETQNSIKLWNLYTGELLNTLNEEIDITSSKNVSSIKISPEGKYLISIDNYSSEETPSDRPFPIKRGKAL